MDDDRAFSKTAKRLDIDADEMLLAEFVWDAALKHARAGTVITKDPSTWPPDGVEFFALLQYKDKSTGASETVASTGERTGNVFEFVDFGYALGSENSTVRWWPIPKDV
jgi:hypothetical protein